MPNDGLASEMEKGEDQHSSSSLFLLPFNQCVGAVLLDAISAQLRWQDEGCQVRPSAGVLELEKVKTLFRINSSGRAGASPEPCCQLLHRRFALFCFLLGAAQDVPQLLKMVQCAHQLTFHCFHLALQHLCVMERVSPVPSAGAHFFLQVLH